MTEVFRLTRPVEFNHCDPAGMVFYPRYFEMISATIERFLADAVDYSWQDMGVFDGGMGTPMGRIEVRFANPSYLGEALDFDLTITRLGRASLTVAIRCSCDGQTRFDCTATIIHARTGGGSSAPWPEAVRDRMAAYLIPSEPTAEKTSA
ncbi:acyl-CoA thioesterase [Pseudooceanicola sp.]|uniref:acyl-CoA thioesterase n=1 Tax=Pseudooceanicola sp. TaxID=1914328 RepID=UPI0035C695F9